MSSDGKGAYKHNRNYSESYKVLDTPVGEEDTSSPTKDAAQKKTKKTGQKMFSGFFSKISKLFLDCDYYLQTCETKTNHGGFFLLYEEND